MKSNLWKILTIGIFISFGLAKAFAEKRIDRAFRRFYSLTINKCRIGLLPGKEVSPPQAMAPVFLIRNQWILTNAHVVSNSRLLLIKKISNPRPYIARVIAIAHDSDFSDYQSGGSFVL